MSAFGRESPSRHGIEGKWAAVSEERDQLLAKTQDQEVELRELRDALAESRAEKALKISTVRHLLDEALTKGGELDLTLLEELSASVRQAQDRAEQAEHRTRLKLNAEEQKAMDGVLVAFNMIGNRWKLRANQSELTAAVHVIQGFIQQHMLSRLAPDDWGSWWEELNEGKGTDG